MFVYKPDKYQTMLSSIWILFVNHKIKLQQLWRTETSFKIMHTSLLCYNKSYQLLNVKVKFISKCVPWRSYDWTRKSVITYKSAVHQQMFIYAFVDASIAIYTVNATPIKAIISWQLTPRNTFYLEIKKNRTFLHILQSQAREIPLSSFKYQRNMLYYRKLDK